MGGCSAKSMDATATHHAMVPSPQVMQLQSSPRSCRGIGGTGYIKEGCRKKQPQQQQQQHGTGFSTRCMDAEVAHNAGSLPHCTLRLPVGPYPYHGTVSPLHHHCVASSSSHERALALTVPEHDCQMGHPIDSQLSTLAGMLAQIERDRGTDPYHRHA